MRKKQLLFSLIVAFFAVFQTQAQNLLAGWDGTGKGTNTDLPSAFGWLASPTVTWGLPTSTSTDRYRDDITYDSNTARVLATSQTTTRIYAKSFTASSATKYYTLSGKFGFINGGSNPGNFKVSVNSSSDNTGTYCGTNTSSSNQQRLATNVTFKFLVPSAGTYYFTYQNSSNNRGIFSSLSIVESGDANTVTFDTNGGSSVTTKYFIPGTSYTITQPSDPTKDGYVFGGWYTDATYATAFNFSTAVTNSTTVYAKFSSSDITTSASSIAFTTSAATPVINATGTGLSSDITITVPSSHITLSGGNTSLTGTNTYTIALANANQLNAITASWDKGANVTGNIVFTSGSVTKNVSVSTDDVESVAMAGITLSNGVLNTAFAVGTTSYTTKAPADVISITVNATTTPSIGNVTNSGTVISATSPSVVLTGNSYDGNAHTSDYTVTWNGNYTLTDWGANGDVSSTVYSLPSNYGWKCTNIGTPNTVVNTWNNFGTQSACRYRDNTANYTYNGAPFTGRTLAIRWDGTGGNNSSSVYSYPVYLEGCKVYNFVAKGAYNSVATAPVLTFKINSASDNSGTTYGTALDTTTTLGTLKNVQISNFKVPSTGVYYVTITSSTASMCAVSDFQITENTTESMSVSPTSLLLYEGHLSKTFTVSGNHLTNDISLSAPNGITLSAAGVTSGKDITLLKGDAQCGIIVTATWDNASAIIDQPINITSGAFSQSVNIYADKNDCSAPIYNDHTNLISEPNMNVLSGYTNSWGALTLATGSEAYCGYASAKLVGVNGASITTPNISWLPSTKYRIRAMVKTVGDFQFGLQNTYAGTGATYEIVIPSTDGQWKQVDYIFTTGSSAVAGYAFFNMQNRGGTLGYIDNWEIYNISDLTSEPNFGVKAWEQKVDQALSTTTFEVAPGGRLTINSAKTLTATNVTLFSDESGTATLIDNGTISGTVSIKQYLTGSTNSETGAPNGRFWYVASPIDSAKSAVFTPTAGNKLWSHSEASTTYAPISDDVTNLTLGLGYVARMKANTTVTFTGKPNTGDISVPVTRTGTTNTYRGFNLIGNPYPSFARIKADENIDIESSLWFRTKIGASNTMVFDSYNILTGDSVSGSGNPISGFIPPMQAFWVKKTTVGTANVAFKQAYRFHKDPITTGIRLRSDEIDTTPCLRIRLTNGKTKDETLIKLYPNATDGFDAFDTHKMTNSLDSFPEIFTMNGKDELAINGMRHDGKGKAIALGFRSGKPGKFTFKVVEKRNMNDSLRVILKDKEKGIEKELDDTTSYEFTTDVALTTSDRFSIVIGKVATSISKTVGSSADVYTDNDNYINVRLIGTASNNSVVKVFNTMGQEVGKFVNNSVNTVLGKRFAPGVYVVNVASEGLQFNKKVVINQ